MGMVSLFFFFVFIVRTNTNPLRYWLIHHTSLFIVSDMKHFLLHDDTGAAGNKWTRHDFILVVTLRLRRKNHSAEDWMKTACPVLAEGSRLSQFSWKTLQDPGLHYHTDLLCVCVSRQPPIRSLSGYWWPGCCDQYPERSPLSSVTSSSLLSHSLLPRSLISSPSLRLNLPYLLPAFSIHLSLPPFPLLCLEFYYFICSFQSCAFY